ncbi:sugar-phosphate isomerase, RpiB/LacA/LacB family [Thermoanaerobacterium thermosaccharolyticum DSM 571]|uniref:Sugar-phosphate isomerase, RpiB/LacA/LacB family n=1 Tax=Thermoanaerobacterium thermosaccharolyticum (strain ATCC 7956 / DSM 571 / NCIMB 9385 / NCA 3814 / NCTC 13789 / WDCM 00135 / 2032) TaxID=580327 RepID=D9TTE7_THETC|nr:ribose 5-phosphate isomerase B [Thermoanaerobacterium thermosaccharolyticum]ADL69923.1 sugar-phosphate isomerase, RpiB/LacA/LacB family [Thermoanaerobacterium thermosaccharolyticum DSM 571]
MIAIGSDHAGFELKEIIKEYLDQRGIEYKDFGTFDKTPTDTADIAQPVAEAVANNECERGILICGTGIGMSIAANKVPKIRAALVENVFSAKSSREHNNANIICLGARVIGSGLALMIIDTWLNTEFKGEDKRIRRINKITNIERKYCNITK